MATKKQTDEARQRRKAQGKAKRETVASVQAECERLRAALTVHQQRIAGDVARLHGEAANLRGELHEALYGTPGKLVSASGDAGASALLARVRLLETQNARLAGGFWARAAWLLFG